VLAKFADLPQEVEAETRNLEDARRRIAALEREIRSVGSARAAPQIDQAAIERAVKAAVEQERTAWRRRIEKGRARLRQMTAAAASAGQLVDTLKVLVEGTEREWSAEAAAELPAHAPHNHRQRVEGAVQRPMPVSNNINGSPRLLSGERRILTALAQYPDGRSKVQVALLTGYAANGGGFNNYLGALRSRELIDGNADRLTITEAGIQALGSWEPLPKGAELIEYWRGRLGKAERLILETLAEAYPGALAKDEVAEKAGYEANGGGFNNALGRLRTLELVQGRRELKASDNLF
jgi:uncharacterized protein